MYLWWCGNIYKRLQSFIWRYCYWAFLRFCLGIDSNVQPGVPKKFGWIWLEWFARGQGIWLQIFEKNQIPTLCPASPPPAGITLIGALAWKRIFSFLSAANVRLYFFSDLNLTVHHYVQSWPSSWGTNGRNGWVRSIRIAENGYRYLLVQMVLKRLHDKPNQILGSYDQICTLGWSISYEFTVYMQKFNGNTFKHWCNSGL